MLLCIALIASLSLTQAVNQKPNAEGLTHSAMLVQQATPRVAVAPAQLAEVSAQAATTGASYWPSLLILTSCTIGFIMAISYTYATKAIQIVGAGEKTDSGEALLPTDDVSVKQMQRVAFISQQISEGADSFLQAEYTYILIFMVVFSALLLGVICPVESTAEGVFTTIAFVIGCCTSMLCGFIGMKIATFANSRTTVECAHSENGIARGFVAAFKAGSVMGFALTAFGILILYMLVEAFSLNWSDWSSDQDDCEYLFHCIAGYGLGGSSVALFGRVGGGIYTKAADVGADLCKIEMSMNEDSAQNPAVIADNVGDNVGDIAGMGADLFGSFAESTCATMVIISQSDELYTEWNSLMLPIIVASLGIVVCMITSFFASHIGPPDTPEDVEPVLKRQLLISTILMTPMSYVACYYFLPSTFSVSTTSGITPEDVFASVACGLWSGLIIGYVTEYYTSKAHTPVIELAESTETGAATNIIYGLALGYMSVIAPIACLSVTVYVSWSVADMLGIAMAAVGILSTMSIGLTIDGFGPICDNAGGIAEMAGFPSTVRDRTDALDAAGNTTAAIGKGFAIGSAALVSLALWGAFLTSLDMDTDDVSMMDAFVFAGLLFGAMLPYWFSGLTMRAVGQAAREMVIEVRRQFADTSKVNPNDPPGALRKGQALIKFLRTEDKRVELEGHVEKREEAAAGQSDEKDAKYETYTHAELDSMNLVSFETAIANMSLADCRTELKEMFHDLETLEDNGQVPLPDYDRCIQISTKASLRQMFAPGALVMITPLVVGFLFGVQCLAGMLTGILVSGVQMAISMSNTGGAWDNAKKYVEAGNLTIHKQRVDDDGNAVLGENNEPILDAITAKKGSDYHKAAVVGDTVGDPMKDTSGPAINILIKLSAITSLVFSATFPSVDDGGYLSQLFDSF